MYEDTFEIIVLELRMNTKMIVANAVQSIDVER